MPVAGFHIPWTTTGACSRFPENARFLSHGARESMLTKNNRITGWPIRVVCTVIFVVLMLSVPCFSAEVVLLRSADSPSIEQRQLEFATQFYGLDLKVVTVGVNQPALVSGAIRPGTTVAVAIEAKALANINQKALLQALSRGRTGNIPLLILGVTSETDPSLLGIWSGNTAIGVSSLGGSTTLHYVVGKVPELTQQLAGLEFPFPGDKTFFFDMAGHVNAKVILAVESNHQAFPTFIEEVDLHGQKLFLLCKTHSSGDNTADKIPDSVDSAFEEIAAVMMFTKYCAGERGWHTLHHYANFTIDDPWLREPYGYVDYKGLFGEMEKHDFHTTIAFIPWNYDRSQPEVVSLFRNHPDRFSISVHGDNHDHKEFTDYRSKPLAAQVRDLKQALVRMDQFQALTGIPYDKVMIFPHSIAPEQTLGALKTYNYLATVNSSNVPQNTIRSTSLPETLRPVTLSFEGFPSISRYSTEVDVSQAYVAINQFLGNPLFFYDHSDYFSKGIGAFDQVADKVNKLEPATEWRGLGEIVRHLYAVKLRDDSDYDVLAFSNDICLENTVGRSSTFYVQKKEIGGYALNAVTVDGRTHPYTFQDGQIRLDVPIPSGGTRCVAITYANDLQSTPVNLTHDSFVVYLLRRGSDFRDIYLAKSGIGLTIIRFYNEHQLMPAKVIRCLLPLLIVMVYAGYILWMSLRKRGLSNLARSAVSLNRPPNKEHSPL